MGGLYIFAAYFWHSRGWEAMLKQTSRECAPWPIACDANMESGQFGEGEWYNEAAAVKVLENRIATYRARDPHGGGARLHVQ